MQGVPTPWNEPPPATHAPMEVDSQPVGRQQAPKAVHAEIVPAKDPLPVRPCASEIAKEMLIVLSFFKPVIDLRRLMGGHEVDGAPFYTQTERSICKIIETVCESVPASIIAMVALLLIGKWASAPIVSIGISWITTAFKATSLTFTLDTDRKSRKKHPQ